MASVTEILRNRIAGKATYLTCFDANGHKFELRPNADTHSLDAYYNGAVAPAGALRKVSAKTASYTVLESESGTLFTTSGASGAVTFTLPALANVAAGTWFEFFNVADQDMIVASGDADKMVVFNDAAADSIAFSTAAEQIGSGVRVVSDGALWLVFVFLGAETATPTIAT